MKELYLSGIDWESIADGLGMRVTIFVSGCEHQCNGCQNEDTWNYQYGEQFTKGIETDIFKSMKREFIDGITLSGGCPMCNATALIPFIKRFKKKFPDRNIWCYCGETFESIVEDKMSDKYRLLEMIDVLVDRPFVLSKRCTTVPYRGSTNQRVINVKSSLKSTRVIELELE